MWLASPSVRKSAACVTYPSIPSGLWSLSFPPPPRRPPYVPPPLRGTPTRPPPRPPPPPFPPRASCIFFRGSSLSSRLSFQAPRIEVRGFTGALCSCGRASRADGGCGCAAGKGPAAACALALVVHPATASPSAPAAPKNLRYLDFMALISRPALLVHSFRYMFSFSVPKVPSGLELVGSSLITEPHHLEASGTLGLPVDCGARPHSLQPRLNRRSARQQT